MYDGFRHSFASYRIRQLKGDLNKLAEEMGNSPREIINSYKRNVRDEDTALWFSITPPAGTPSSWRLHYEFAERIS